MSSVNSIALYEYVTNADFKFYDGIKIRPQKRLNEILDSDIRKQYFNYGYFILDLTDCVVTVSGEYYEPGFPKGKWKSFTEPSHLEKETIIEII